MSLKGGWYFSPINNKWGRIHCINNVSGPFVGALISMCRDAGDITAALGYARKLAVALPDDPAVQQLMTELEGAM